MVGQPFGRADRHHQQPDSDADDSGLGQQAFVGLSLDSRF